jgi:hypothetical protein
MSQHLDDAERLIERVCEEHNKACPTAAFALLTNAVRAQQRFLRSLPSPPEPKGETGEGAFTAGRDAERESIAAELELKASILGDRPSITATEAFRVFASALRNGFEDRPAAPTPPAASETAKCATCGTKRGDPPYQGQCADPWHGTAARSSPATLIDQRGSINEVEAAESKPGETAGASLPPREGGGIHLAMLSDDDLEEALWLRARALELAVGLIGPPQQRILGLREALRELRPVLWTWEDRHTTRAEALAGALNAACERADKERDAERSRPTPQSPELSVEEWEALYVTVGAETNPVATMAQLALVKLEEGHRVPIAHSLSVPSPVEPAQEDEDTSLDRIATIVRDITEPPGANTNGWHVISREDRDRYRRAVRFAHDEGARSRDGEVERLKALVEEWGGKCDEFSDRGLAQEKRIRELASVGSELTASLHVVRLRLEEICVALKLDVAGVNTGEILSAMLHAWSSDKERIRELEQERNTLREALDEVARGDREELKAAEAKVAAWSELVEAAIQWRSSRPVDPRDATGRLSRSLVEAVDAVPQELRPEGAEGGK